VKSHETRSPGSDKAEQHHVQISQALNSPEAYLTKMKAEGRGVGQRTIDAARAYLTGKGDMNDANMNRRAHRFFEFINQLAGQTLASLAGTLPALQAVAAIASAAADTYSDDEWKNWSSAIQAVSAGGVSAEKWQEAVLAAGKILHRMGMFDRNGADQFAGRLQRVGIVYTNLQTGLNSAQTGQLPISLIGILTSNYFESDLARFDIAWGGRPGVFNHAGLYRDQINTDARSMKRSLQQIHAYNRHQYLANQYYQAKTAGKFIDRWLSSASLYLHVLRHGDFDDSTKKKIFGFTRSVYLRLWADCIACAFLRYAGTGFGARTQLRLGLKRHGVLSPRRR
jgi:hypothetical protein